MIKSQLCFKYCYVFPYHKLNNLIKFCCDSKFLDAILFVDCRPNLEVRGLPFSDWLITLKLLPHWLKLKTAAQRVRSSVRTNMIKRQSEQGLE